MATIGRYRLAGVIGIGAFATVHVADDPHLRDRVAIKVLADNHGLDPDVRERFIAEGRALRRIDSLHVIKAWDIGETERQQPYLVLEHADRGSLRDRVATRRSTGWQPVAGDVVTMARSLAEAVRAVHAAGLVHRDLSAANVLVRSDHRRPTDRVGDLLGHDERLVVADLGMCKDLARSSGLTVAGGTDGFRPPEQRTTPSTVDERADLWALSQLLVWLVIGDTADDPATLAWPSAGWTDRLRPVLARSLAVQPAKRHPDVGAWLDAVQDAVADPTSTAPVPAPRSTAPPAPGAARSRSRRPAVLVVVAAMLAGALVAGGFGAVRERAQAPTVEVGANGNLIVVDTDGSASLTLTGPDRATVGSTVTYRAEGNAVARWAWILPDGRVVDSAPQVALDTNSEGVARVTLSGRSPTGTDLRATIDLVVRDP